MRLALLIAALWAVATTAGAQTRSIYDVSLAHVPVGRMSLGADEKGGAYSVTADFTTRGVASIVDASFRLSAQGRIGARGLTPHHYDERIDTGSRRSTVTLAYRGGVPRVTGGSVADDVAEDPDALDPATQKGTLDPLTALYGALRDRPAEGLCRYDVVIFDGERRARLAMTGRSRDGGRVTCAGAYTRLAGFSASEMARQTRYPFSITYAPAGQFMRAAGLSVRSRYGTARLTRR